MINRRSFFKALAGAAAVAFTHTVDLPASIVPAPAVVPPLIGYPAWINFANAVAFNFVANALPEHSAHYRVRAFEALRNVQKTQHGRKLLEQQFTGYLTQRGM